MAAVDDTMVAARPGLRWSSTVSCPRLACYEADGAPARERTDQEDRILFRGRQLGHMYADLMEHTHGAGNVLREVKVEWPLGVGHIDVVLTHKRVAIEVLSSAFATHKMVHRKLLQLVGYMEHYPHVDSGMLVVINPSDLSEERHPIVRSSYSYRLLAEECAQRIRAVQEWSETGRLPDRECSRPSESIGRFCLHADHCFDGWQPPPMAELDADEDTCTLVRQVWQAKTREAQARQGLGEIERERKQLEQQLAARLEGQPDEVLVSGFRVRRTDVQRSPSFDWRKAERAGMFEPGMFDAEFWKPGASYTTWRVDRTELAEFGDHHDDGFGEEAPF